MEFFVTLFIATLFKNIFLDYFFVRILPNRVNVVPVSPKLSAPQLLFYLRMKTEKLSRTNAFHHLNDRFCRHHWNALYQKMNMIFIGTNLQKVYFKSVFNISTYIRQTLCNFIRQNTSPIFYRANQMIQKQTLVMPFMNMFAHNTNVIQTATPQQAARNSLD